MEQMPWKSRRPHPFEPETWDPALRRVGGRGTFGGVRLAGVTRLASGLIDYGLPVLLINQAPWPVGLLAAGAVIAHSGVYQGLTGQTFGKRLLGLQLGRPVGWPEDEGKKVMSLVYPGPVRGAIRAAINLLVLLSVPGIMLSVLGHYHRSWGDRWVKTIVIERGWTMELMEAQEGQVSAMIHPTVPPRHSR